MKTRAWVFGANLAGIHGAGSAKEAKKHWGAVQGVGVGRTGDAYAIPTKTRPGGIPLTLPKIQEYVTGFLEYARAHEECTFEVVKIGTGLAGYSEGDIAPMFAGAPDNVRLPEGWRAPFWAEI